MREGITFGAQFFKATTTLDGGWAITFSVGQDEALKVTQLAQLRDTPLQVGVICVLPKAFDQDPLDQDPMEGDVTPEDPLG